MGDHAKPSWSQALRGLGGDPDGRLSELGAARAARPLQALAEPTRVGIVAVLADRPASALELAATLSRAPSDIGFHLRALVDNGVVEPTRDTVTPTANSWQLTGQGQLLVPVLALLALPVTQRPR